MNRIRRLLNVPPLSPKRQRNWFAGLIVLTVLVVGGISATLFSALASSDTLPDLQEPARRIDARVQSKKEPIQKKKRADEEKLARQIPPEVQQLIDSVLGDYQKAVPPRPPVPKSVLQGVAQELEKQPKLKNAFLRVLSGNLRIHFRKWNPGAFAGELEKAKAVHCLCVGLYHRHTDVQNYSARALGKLKDHRAVPSLMDIARLYTMVYSESESTHSALVPVLADALNAILGTNAIVERGQDPEGIRLALPVWRQAYQQKVGKWSPPEISPNTISAMNAFRKHADKVSFLMRYHSPDKTKTSSRSLWLFPQPIPFISMGAEVAILSKDEMQRLMKFLADHEFFELASKGKLQDPNKLGGHDYFTWQVFNLDGDLVYYEVVFSTPRSRAHFAALRRVLSGEAAKKFDVLLNELQGGQKKSAQKRSPKTEKAVAQLKRNLDKVKFSIWPRLSQFAKTGFNQLVLDRQASSPMYAVSVIKLPMSEQQALKLIEHLADDGFFDRAKDVKDGLGYQPPAKQSYGFIIQSVKGAPVYYEEMDIDQKFMRRLWAARNVFDGLAAAEMDKLLQALNKNWHNPGRDGEPPADPPAALIPATKQMQPLLKVSLAPDKKKYAWNERIKLTITYTNLSKEPLHVSAYSVEHAAKLHPGYLYPLQFVENVQLADSTGKSIYVLRVPQKKEVKMIAIKPGKSWSRTIANLKPTLSKDFPTLEKQPPPFKNAGEYTIRMRSYNALHVSRTERITAGAVYSNSVKVKILPKEK